MSEQSPQQEQSAGVPQGAARKRTGPARLVPRRKGARWAALGAAVVIVGGGAAAVAVAEHHHEQEAAFGPGRAGADHEGVRMDGRGREDDPAAAGKRAALGPAGVPGTAVAPAPLPSLGADQAVVKAAAAVAGGRVESLRVVGQQGGGSAWLAVVIGPDGVRHDVTLSGADGAVTGNTVAAGTGAATGGGLPG